MSFLVFFSCRQEGRHSSSTASATSPINADSSSDELPVRDSVFASSMSQFPPGNWKGRIYCDRFVNLYDTTQVLKKETEVTLAYDDFGFHFLTLAEEEDVKFNYTKRDTCIWKDPCIEIFLDPLADRENYYELQINAFPQVWDLKLKSSQPPVNDPSNMLSWDIGNNFGIGSKAYSPNDDTNTDKHWGVVGTIDWNVFSEGKPKARERWAYNIMRIDYDKNDIPTYWVAKSTGKQNIHHPSTWPIYTF